MKLTDVINKISVLYREELEKKRELQRKLREIDTEFEDAVEHGWETMSVARRDELKIEWDSVERELDSVTKRAEGMFDVRELFIEMIGSEED